MFVAVGWFLNSTSLESMKIVFISKFYSEEADFCQQLCTVMAVFYNS